MNLAHLSLGTVAKDKMPRCMQIPFILQLNLCFIWTKVLHCFVIEVIWFGIFFDRPPMQTD